MKGVLQHIQRLDWILTGSVFLLCVMGMVSIASSSQGLGDFSNLHKQVFFVFMGFGIMLFLSFFDYRILRNDPYFLVFAWGFGVASFAGLLLFAPEIRGVQSWYRIGGITIDPVEFMKILLVVIGAKYLANRHSEIYRVRHIVLSGAYFLIPAFLVFLQPNLGSASVLGFIWIVLMLAGGIKLRHFIFLCILGGVLGGIGWGFFLHDYQKERIVSFLQPELDPLGIGWSQQQSRVALGNGGLFGKGFGEGTQTQYGFLSEPQNDFIFAAIGEEFGLAGVAGAIILFLILLFRVFNTGTEARNNFQRLFATGFGALLIFQFFVNVGMNVGFLPIIGLSLPFVSYGGSSLLALFAGLGILQSMRTHS